MERENRRSNPDRTAARRRPAPKTPVRKKKRRSPVIRAILYILTVCGVSVLLALAGWSMANDVLALNKEEGTAVISIQDNSDFDGVVDQLKENGIINYKAVFRLFCHFAHGQEKIQPGTYELNTNMDYRAILNNLGSRSATRMEKSVTITEGMTVRQIFQLLEEQGVSTVARLEDTAANHNYRFSFLEDIPLGSASRLEGFLFPDTYNFYMGEDPKYVINKMLVNFDAKVTDAMREQIWDQEFSIRAMITVASMIEKEATSEDRFTISSVIRNRLDNPNSGTQGYLQVDATIQYVLPEGQTVTEADYSSVDSPYNTYLYKGLPPGPIANPGLESILAAINPERTNYFYYALGDDGAHHFFKTYNAFLNFLNS